MTVREFADAYEIDYQVVYSATWLTKPISTSSYRNKQYDEEDMKDAIRRFVTQRIDKHRQSIQKDERILRKLDAAGGRT